MLNSNYPWTPHFSFSFGLVLILCGCGQTPVSQLASDLRDDDHDVRYAALKELEEYGPESSAAIEELSAALSDPAPKVRYRSAKVLSKIGIGAAPAAEALAGALRAYPSTLMEASSGRKSLNHQTVLGREGKNSDAKMRYYLVKALANIEGDAVVALEALTQIVEADEDARTRYYAAKALGKIGKEASAALPALEKAQEDSDPKVRKAVAQAIKKVKG